MPHICSTITESVLRPDWDLSFIALKEKRSVILVISRTPSKTFDMISKPSSMVLRFSIVVLSSRILFVFVHAAEPRADRPFGRPPVCFSQKSACQLAKVATFSSAEAEVLVDDADAPELLLLGPDVVLGESFGSVESLPIGVLNTLTSFSVTSLS